MAFLVLLITLGCYKFFSLRVDRKFDRWFYQLAEKMAAIFQGNPAIATLSTLLLPVALVGLLLNLLEDALFGLMGVALHVVLLFYSLGRDNLLQCTREYLKRWNSGDVQSAYHYAEEHLKVQGNLAVSDLASLQREVHVGILYQWFEQVFLILFWYLLAGPLVALFIRLVSLYDQWLKNSEEVTSTPLQIVHALEWLPVRLLGLTFTLAGNFVLCFQCWLKAVVSWHMPTEKVLYNSGMAALGVCAESVQEAIQTSGETGTTFANVMEDYAKEISFIEDLLIRSLVVWVVIVAIMVIF